MLVINLKAYRQAVGSNSEKIADKIIKGSENFDKRVIIAAQPQDLLRLDKKNVEIFAQHIDPEKPGSHTGHILAEGVKEAGATGTLINHSEMRVKKEKIKKSIRRASENNLSTIVCAQSPEECKELSKLDPDYIAYEPPELIGSDTSVSEARSELINKAVKKSETPVLTGAGIKDTEDVEKSIQLGCQGVLVASGVVKAENIEKETKSLLEGL